MSSSSSNHYYWLCLTLLAIAALLLLDGVEASSTQRRARSPGSDYAKQFINDPESRETDPPNFVRLVVMRLIYGLAVQMGIEDRLSGVLNGIFVPPNAEDDDYGGGFGDDVGDFGGAGDLFDF